MGPAAAAAAVCLEPDNFLSGVSYTLAGLSSGVILWKSAHCAPLTAATLVGGIVCPDCTLLSPLDSGNVLWVRVPRLVILLPRLKCDSKLSPTVRFGT